MPDQVIGVADDSAAVEAALLAAAKNGFGLTRAAAKAITEAVLNTPDHKVSVTNIVWVHVWDDTEYQAYIRRELQTDLFHAMVAQGVVPAGPMTETLSYLETNPLGHLTGRSLPVDHVDRKLLRDNWSVSIELTVSVRHLVPQDQAAAPPPAVPHPGQLLCGNGRMSERPMFAKGGTWTPGTRP